ncbi:MAG: Hsp70 family protein, partial [Polaromonas sp.]|nr:Hsp70 family protein [Polaromonas sp.]
AGKADRRDDILASGGVHIGGTDFDKYLSLASVMPSLGLGSLLKSGLLMPSAPYFNLATWHTINFEYTKKAAAQLSELRREAAEPDKLDRLQALVAQRAGHWLAMQVEEAKMALSAASDIRMDLGRISAGETLLLQRAGFDGAISALVDAIAASVKGLLRDAGVPANAVDTVFFTGGSSSVPLLRARIAALLPQSRRVEGDLFGSIGAGLAIDALRQFG